MTDDVEKRADAARPGSTTSTQEERPPSAPKRDDGEQMRSNPEVMGRSEPKDLPEPKVMGKTEPKDLPEPKVMGKTEPKDLPEPKDMPGRRGGPIEKSPSRADDMDFWPEMQNYKHRMVDIQSEFIEEPRAAVEKAEQLVEEAVDYMAKAMHEHVQRMHKDVEGDADTEKLRLMMRNFSHFFERLDLGHAA
jgi:hypothetical protein